MEKLETASTLSVTYANLPVKHCIRGKIAPKSYMLAVLHRGKGRFGDQFETCENFFLLNASGCVYSWIRVRIVDSCRRVRGSMALWNN